MKLANISKHFKQKQLLVNGKKKANRGTDFKILDN